MLKNVLLWRMKLNDLKVAAIILRPKLHQTHINKPLLRPTYYELLIVLGWLAAWNRALDNYTNIDDFWSFIYTVWMFCTSLPSSPTPVWKLHSGVVPFSHPFLLSILGLSRFEGVEVFVVKDNSWTFQELTGPVDTIETLPETAWNLIVCMFGLFPGSFQGG